MVLRDFQNASETSSRWPMPQAVVCGSPPAAERAQLNGRPFPATAEAAARRGARASLVAPRPCPGEPGTASPRHRSPTPCPPHTRPTAPPGPGASPAPHAPGLAWAGGARLARPGRSCHQRAGRLAPGTISCHQRPVGAGPPRAAAHVAGRRCGRGPAPGRAGASPGERAAGRGARWPGTCPMGGQQPRSPAGGQP
jgi:translation initiation factor IF-2